jgi:hypothetical protein
MMFKLHNRALSRIAMAGLLAAGSWSSFAQTPITSPSPAPATSAKPGSMASAQAQTRASAAPAIPIGQPENRLKPSVIRPTQALPSTDGTYPPSGASAGNATQVALQPDRLKPSIIRPNAPSLEMPLTNGAPPHPGMSMEQAMPTPGPMHQQGPTPGMGSTSVNPFAPAPVPVAIAPTPPPSVNAVPALANAAQANGKKGQHSGSLINLDCSTPEIKQQGVFIGKIQNRYVYKYKSQYCFDLEP